MLEAVWNAAVQTGQPPTCPAQGGWSGVRMEKWRSSSHAAMCTAVGSRAK